uniref:Uncharacterized protein n=1 Tax=Ditylenchus dipsaci TaxID=166011 RepID=A0A915EI95_9BILA
MHSLYLPVFLLSSFFIQIACQRKYIEVDLPNGTIQRVDITDESTPKAYEDEEEYEDERRGRVPCTALKPPAARRGLKKTNSGALSRNLGSCPCENISRN